MDKIIILTDLHLTDADRIIGLDPHARFAATLTAAVTDHPDARALILMGDLAHHGSRAAYAALRDRLARLPMPVIPMLGNHDHRATFLSVFPDTATTATGHVQHRMDLLQHRIITLDTLSDDPSLPRHAGQLCDDRLAWLDTELATLGDRTALVFAHHPPFRTGLPGMDAIRLTHPDTLLSRLAPHRCHLFCGHIHRTISGSTDGTPWTIFKSPCHQAPLDLTTADSSLSIDEAPAYGLLLLPSNGVIAHSQDVDFRATAQRDPASK